MATTIYKTITNVRGDLTSFRSGNAACDLSNYYTKTELLMYHGARIHYSNIVYDGMLGGKAEGDAIVTGYLRQTNGLQGRVDGEAVVTAFIHERGRLQGQITGVALVTGFFTLTIGSSLDFEMSLEEDSTGTVTLVNDEETPGNSQYYGTDGTGTKGFFALPEGTSYTFDMSVEVDSLDVVTLVGDEASPGNSQLYGTNASGVKGWYDIPTSGTPDAHATTHQNNGSDEISVAGLSGVLADAQTPIAHDLTSAYHTDSGLTTGHFLKATGTDTFAWAAHGLTYTDVNASGSDHLHTGVYEPNISKSTGYATWSGSAWVFTSPALAAIGNGTAQYQIPVTGTTPFTPSWTTVTNLVGTNGLNSLSYVSASFVKMTGANTFTLDTNTYLTSVTSHNLLSATHGDTAAGSVVRGDIIYGNATPAWARLAFPASPTGKVLQATATDVAWSTNAITIGTSASVSGSNTGDVTLATNHGLSLSSQVIGMGTPSSITTTSTNSVTTTTHTHAITAALGFIGNGSAQYQIPVTGATPFTPSWTTATNLVGANGLNSLSYSSLSFVKMSAAGTFTLDTATYVTSSHNHDSSYISIVSTPTTGNFPVLTSGGELNNSVYSYASFATADHLHTGTYQPSNTNLTSLAGLTYASLSFVKMSASGTFSLDTNTYAATTHSHGNITSAGAIGTTASLPIITTTSGVLTTGSFGTGSGTFCQGNDSRLSDARTPAAHDLTSSYHTDSGLTTGHFLKATGATTFAWGAHGLTYTDVGAQQTHTNLTSLSALTYASLSFVKMSAAGTFSLDTATYASGTHNHDSSYISIISTPTTGNFPTMTSGGELQTSTYSSSSFATSGHTHTNMVDYTGTPANNYIAVFTDTNTIEGTSGLTYSGTALYVSGTVTSTGDMTSTNFCLSSDIRQKTNVNCYCHAPELKIDYQSFEFKTAPGVTRYGAIAQEVQKDYPELVRKGEDGMLAISYIDLLVREVAYLKRRLHEYEERLENN